MYDNDTTSCSDRKRRDNLLPDGIEKDTIQNTVAKYLPYWSVSYCLASIVSLLDLLEVLSSWKFVLHSCLDLVIILFENNCRERVRYSNRYRFGLSEQTVIILVIKVWRKNHLTTNYILKCRNRLDAILQAYSHTKHDCY